MLKILRGSSCFWKHLSQFSTGIPIWKVLINILGICFTTIKAWGLFIKPYSAPLPQWGALIFSIEHARYTCSHTHIHCLHRMQRPWEVEGTPRSQNSKKMRREGEAINHLTAAEGTDPVLSLFCPLSPSYSWAHTLTAHLAPGLAIMESD